MKVNLHFYALTFVMFYYYYLIINFDKQGKFLHSEYNRKKKKTFHQ